MKHMIVSLALSFSSFILSAVACFGQCQSTPVTLTQELHQSGSTIVGTVESAQAVPDSSFHMDGVNYTVRIDRVLHGKMVGQSEVTIFSENSGEQFPMAVGQQYLLFVHLDYNRYEVDNCGNSGLLQASAIDNAKQLKQFARNN